jgi:hypothetical protein
LTTMLLNVKPRIKDGSEKTVGDERAVELEAYKQNYVVAYQKCQDKPGGKKAIIKVCVCLLFFTNPVRSFNYQIFSLGSIFPFPSMPAFL